MKVESIVIVGGGSSGWMTAAALSTALPNIGVALVESKNIKTIGVGESTLGHINRYLRLLKLKDEDWMPKCNATYKNSIRFTDFREKGSIFEYPFGKFDLEDKTSGLMDWHELRAHYPEQFPPESFARFYNVNTYLAEYNKQTKNENGELRGFNFKLDTAYHMDAELFGQYLKNEVAIPNGVQHIEGTVISWELESPGNIKSITTDSGYVLEADLFIDCTGFKSLLLEQIQEVVFVPFKDTLMNDRAIATRIPYVDREEEMENVTNCTAIEHGWVWNIPLWNRIGTGYVYSSTFISPEQAEQEFRNHLARDPRFEERAEKAEMFDVRIRHGKRKVAWKNNVIGVGLAYGFIEPLESTGLMTTHENILRLIELLSKRDGFVNNLDRDMYNYACDYEIESFKEFVSAHYALSMRDDTDYWHWVTNLIHYRPDTSDSVIRRTMTWEHMTSNYLISPNVTHDSQGMNYIVAGMGYNAASKHWIDMLYYHNGHDHSSELVRMKEQAIRYEKDVLEIVKSLPSHYQFLRDQIYGGVDQYAV
jgi:hypothetical protein